MLWFFWKDTRVSDAQNEINLLEEEIRLNKEDRRRFSNRRVEIYDKNERIVCEGKIVVFEKVITTVFYEIIIIKVEGTIK